MTTPIGFVVTGTEAVRHIWCKTCWRNQRSRFGPVLVIWAHWHVCAETS